MRTRDAGASGQMLVKIHAFKAGSVTVWTRGRSVRAYEFMGGTCCKGQYARAAMNFVSDKPPIIAAIAAVTAAHLNLAFNLS